MDPVTAKPFDFDELDPADEPAPAIKTYSLEDIQHAQEEARTQALAQARAGELAAQTAMLETIATKLASARADYNAAAARHGDALSAGAGAIVKRFCKNFSAAREVEMATSLIDRFVNSAPQHTPAKLVLPASVSDSVTKRLSTLINIRDLAGFISIETSNNISDGDCRLEWRGGALDRNLKDAFAQIDAIFTPQQPDSATASPDTTTASPDTATASKEASP